jgi:dipeptidyl aminopeptidase/acylaminoacyl peptidase
MRPVIGLAALGIVMGCVFGVFEPKAHPAQPYASLAQLPPREIEKGIEFQEVHLPGGHDARTLWIYTPQHKTSAHLPCVFIAPDASTCYYGKRLYPINVQEHLPYARAGFFVVAYSVDGNTPYFNSNEVAVAIKRFRAAKCGVENEHAAVDYALANLPMIDTKRLYAAGHSSGGTMALMAAAHDSRFAACVAYAPACDISSRVNKLGAFEESLRVPGFSDFLKTCSPINYTATITCPVFLFHADDDDNVPRADVERFLDKLRRTNHYVTYSRAPAGGHIQSMLKDGIPRGIAWLKQLGNKDAAAS